MEELGAADMAMAVSLSVHILSQYPVVTWGTRRAARPLAAADARRRGPRGLRPDRAARRAATPRRIRTRAERVGPADAPTLPADRHEDLDLERARGGSLPRLRDARPGAGRQGDHGVPRGEGDAGLPVRGARAEDGDPGLPGGGARVRRLPRCPVANRLGEEGRGLQDRAVGARRGPDLDRGGMRRHRPGRRSRRPRGTSPSAGHSGRRSPSSRACGSCSPRWRATWPRHGR